jgi:hypothetical protein
MVDGLWEPEPMVYDMLPGNEWATTEEPARSRPSPDIMFRRLTIAGWGPREAGNLTAHLEGLPPARFGWTVREIGHLLFLRRMRESDRLSQ